MAKHDSVTLNVLHHRLENICQEMGLVMMRTSFSTIFNEGLDFSCVILNRLGDLIAETDYTPSMMGAITHTVRWTVEELGPDAFKPGDVIIHNDCYRGGCHLPEHMMMKPVFLDGELFGFVGNMAHLAEIGGKAVGSFASDATDVYQEGLRLPPLWLMREGEYCQDVWRVILTNHRTPRNSWGDLHAMLGSLHIGERRLQDLARHYGGSFLDSATQELMDYSERRLREEIRRIPNGEYQFEDWLEDDGVSNEPVPIRVKVVVRDDDIIADFTGSSPQTRGPVNCTVAVTVSAVYNAVFSVTDPYIPRNDGCYRPIKFICPPGTVVNVVHPGACVAGNTDTQPKMIDLVLSALARAVPERVAAAHGGTSSNFLFGGVHPETGEYYTNYHFDGMGMGGTLRKDGNSAEITRHSNCRNTPIEVFDTRYPFRHVRYALRPDSAGPGTHRGGFGLERVLEVMSDEINVSALFDRFRRQPWGLFDGEGAQCGSLLIKRKGDGQWRTFAEAFNRVSPSKFTNVVVTRGDLIQIRTPGGGGYGHPHDRPPEEVLDDVREQLVSPEAARAAYGVAVVAGPGGWELDPQGTAELRRKGATQGG